MLLDAETAVHHLDRLVAAARALCGNRADADDLVQEIYLTLLRRPRRLTGGSELAYLMTMLRNAHIDVPRRSAARRRRRWTRPTTRGPARRACARPRDEHREVIGAVHALSSPFRETVVAVDVLGLSYKEAARRSDSRRHRDVAAGARSRARDPRARSRPALGRLRARIGCPAVDGGPDRDRSRPHRDPASARRVLLARSRGPSDADLDAAGELLGLHELALEDTREFGQRPKLDRYPDARAARLLQRARDRGRAGTELDRGPPAHLGRLPVHRPARALLELDELHEALAPRGRRDRGVHDLPRPRRADRRALPRHQRARAAHRHARGGGAAAPPTATAQPHLPAQAGGPVAPAPDGAAARPVRRGHGGDPRAAGPQAGLARVPARHRRPSRRR